MLKLIALKQYLEGLGMFNPERIEVAIEEGEAEFSGSTSGPDLLLYRHTYRGTIDLMGAGGDIRDLLGHVVVWVEDNQGERDNDQFLGYEGEPVDQGRSDVTLRFQFEEEEHYIAAAPAYAGPDKVTVHGADWKRGSKAADVADTLAGVTPSVAP